MHAVHGGMTAMVSYQQPWTGWRACVSIYLGYCGCIRRRGRRGFLTLAGRVNPGCIGTTRLVHLVGPAKARQKSADGQMGAAWHAGGSSARKVQTRRDSDRIGAGESVDVAAAARCIGGLRFQRREMDGWLGKLVTC